MAELDFSRLQKIDSAGGQLPALDFSKLKKLNQGGATTLDFSGLTRLDGEPDTPTATLASGMASRTAAVDAYRELTGRQDSSATAIPAQSPAVRVAPGMMLPGKKRLPSSHGRPTPQPTLGERLGAHAGAAFNENIAGAAVSGVRGGERFARQSEQLDKIIKFAESQGSNVALPLPAELSAPDPLTGIVSPSGSDPNTDAEATLGFRFTGMPISELRSKLQEAQAAYAPLHKAEVERQNVRRFRYETMPGAEGPLEYGAAVVGELAGGLPTPENLVPVTRGPTLLKTFARGAAAVGLTNLLTDPLVQESQIRMGTRDKFDPLRPFLGAAGGAFLGGVLNVSPEVARRIARVVGKQLGKAADAVTNAEAWRTLTAWLRKPESMPDELKATTTPEEGADFTVDAAGDVTSTRPAGPAAPEFTEHVVMPGTGREAPPRYQGAIRGEPYVSPARPTAPTGEPVTVRPADDIPGAPLPPRGPEILPPDAMKPSPFHAGDAGTLGKAVPRTQAQLEGMLKRGDAKRFAPIPSPELRRVARQQQADTIATLERLETEAIADTPNKPETVDFILRTARDRRTRFTLKNDAEVIADFRDKLLGPRGEKKFYSQAPGGAASPAEIGSELPDVAAATRASIPGAAYVGARPQTYNPTAPAMAEPIRREAILRDFITGLGAPIYQGRIKSKKYLGFYRKGLEEVRIRYPADIETAAHEMAHLIDDRIPEVAAQWRPASNANKTFRDELRGVSYDKTKLYEGFAEFVRLWMTQKSQAQAKAPNFYRWFDGFVGRSKYGPTLRKAQTEMHNWFDQNPLDRARSKVGPGPDINEGLTSVFNKFRQSVTDDLHGIANAEKTLTGKLSPVGPYETARLTRGKAAITEGALTIGAPRVLPDGSHTFTGKGLQQILDPVAAELDDFLLYAVGRSASELAGQGREHLFTPAEIKAMLALDRPEFRRAFGEYQRWNAAVLDFAEAKGAIDPMARAAWKRTQYLPFHRVGQPGAFSPVPGDWKGIKALTGGSENLRPILSNIIGNATMLIDAALTNEARVAMADLAKSPGGARFMAKIPTEERSVKVHSSEIERAILEALGISNRGQLTAEQQKVVDQIMAGMGGLTQFLLRGQTPMGRNIVAVLRSGRPEYWEVIDPLVYRALTALKRPTQHWIVRVLALPKRIGQMSITLTADFLAANAVRDTLSGFVMSRHGFKPLIDTARGFKSRIMADDNYKQFIANGGGFSSYMLDESNFRTHLDRFYKRKGIDPKTVLNAPAKLLLALERIADAVEMSTRLGEMRRALAAGEHPRHAAYSAREVSTDFAMRGDSSALGFFYDTVIFFKAGVNGLDRFYRGVAEDPNRVSIAAKIGLLATLSIGLYAINRGNPLYEQLEDWDRDTHWHFFIPKPETFEARRTGTEVPLEERYWHFRMPKIWEIGAISSIAERQTQGLLDGQPLKAQADSLRVIGKLLGFDWVPQLFAPLYEVAINEERFTGRPIETQAMKELEPWARTGARSSSTIRALSEQMRHLPRGTQVLSPAQVEHLIRGYFNTWAQYGLTLTDAAFFDDRPDFRWDQLPVFRRFYRQEPAQQTKYLSELYDAIDAATAARRTMRAMDKTYRPEIATELENREDNLLYKQLSVADQRLRTFRKEMDQVYQVKTLAAVRELVEERAKATRNPDLLTKARAVGSDLGALKRLLLDDIIRERNAYAETMIKDVDQRREELRAIEAAP